MKNIQRWLIALIVVAALAGGGYWAYTTYFSPEEVVEEEEAQTAAVRRGDIIISTGGAATLVPASEIEVGFQTSGVLTELNVDVGDHVDAGDVIARLDDADLQLQVEQAELNLELAEIDLAIAIADAEEALLNAYASYNDAQAALDIENNDDMVQTVLNTKQAEGAIVDAEENLGEALDPARDWERNIDASREAAQASYENALISYEIQQANYNNAVESLEDALDDAGGAIGAAEEELNAVDGTAVQAAQFALEQAQLSLEQTKLTFEQAVLTAPIAGTITAVNAAVGETVGTEALVMIIDLDEPLLQFYLEESDLGLVAVGYPINATFNAWPDDVFAGEIEKVEPALVEIDGTPALQVWASVNVEDREQYPIYSGMEVDVEIMAAETYDALIVPVQGLRELGPDEYAVFVVDENGELEFRPVEVGLTDFANAEILSGLEVGDIVSTGIVDTE